MNKIIIIAGPTASGKTKLGVDIAKRLDSQVISCDSMQIYKHLDIGTAKVTKDEMQGVIHHMIDIVDADQSFSVSEYVDMAKRIIADMHKAGKIPVIVGGTGLYIDALVYQLSFFSNSDPHIRKQLEEELELIGAEKMHARLRELDSAEADKIHPNNTKRLVRALEIYLTSGDTKSSKNEKILNPDYDICMIALDRDRADLYNRIDKRVDIMFDNGLEGEIKDLFAKSLVDWDCQSMQAIGYKEFKDYFDGKISLDQVKYNIQLNSRHYAKRQLSWLRRYEFAKWINIDQDLAELDQYITKIPLRNKIFNGNKICGHRISCRNFAFFTRNFKAKASKFLCSGSTKKALAFDTGNFASPALLDFCKNSVVGGNFNFFWKQKFSFTNVPVFYS